MKALMKIGLIAMLCFSGNAAFGQTPEKKATKTEVQQITPGPGRKASGTTKQAAQPAGKADIKARPARKAEAVIEKETK